MFNQNSTWLMINQSEITYKLEQKIPIKDLGKDLRKLWNTQSEEYLKISSLEVRQHYTFSTDEMKVIRAIYNHLKRFTPMRFFFREITKTPPVSRIFRTEDNTRFKTRKTNLPKL